MAELADHAPFGFHFNDQLLRQDGALERLAVRLRFDDGDSEPPSDWPYRRWEICYGRHSCFMGVVKGLKAGQEVVTAGTHVLQPGQKVRRYQEAAAAASAPRS